ncbi:MAG: hypothetical protein KF696_09340 [Planctomycetes bacterium]|nr:hypothetical protein [Planctomycetota bacterium]MCW8136790.1 hypothetical protein [Planctomycetota bacterium]
MMFAQDIRVREVELARCISQHADVFALDRSDALPRAPQGLWGKLRMRAKLWACATSVVEDGPLSRFRMRITGATGPVLNRLGAASNLRRLQNALRRFSCSHVFLSSPFFFVPPPKSRRDWHAHFDLVDNFHDEWPDTISGRSRRAFLRDAMRNCDTFSASSLSLCDHAEFLTGRKAAYAPNGVPLERFGRFSNADGARLREAHALSDRFVIGFIGNHNMGFDGKEALARAFVVARRTRLQLALLVVGPGSERLSGDGIFAVGPVSPDEVPAYFLACDAGVHPYELRPLTHDATPLNVVEFGIAGRPMLCNPLRELQRLALPHLRFTADASVEAWAAALADPASFPAPDPAALHAAMAPFDWKRSAAIITREMGL